MTFFAKLVFVSASWAPIYVLIAVLTWTSAPGLARILIGVAVASLVLVGIIKTVIEIRFAEDLITIKSSERMHDDIFMYILTYIPPFFAVDLSSAPKLFAIGVLYFIIFVTYIRLGQYHLNPLFVFFGYQVFRVETSGGAELHVITKVEQPIRAGDQIRAKVYADLALVVNRVAGDQKT